MLCLVVIVNTICCAMRMDFMMTFNELYKKFGIPMAEFKQNETANDFGRRVLTSSFINSEQAGVIYSTGSSVDKTIVNQEVKQEYQMYTY